MAVESQIHQTMEGEGPGAVRQADARCYADFPFKNQTWRKAPPPLGFGESMPAALISCLTLNLEGF